MNWGLRILLFSLLLIGCASTPKPVVKKKTTPPAGVVNKTAKVPAPAAAKGVPAKAPAPAKALPLPTTPAEPVEEEHAEEEDDDQYARMKRFYKK